MQGQGGSDCWATAFKLDYSFDGVTWLLYGRTEERDGIVFPGNMNEESVIEHALPSPLFCRFVRFRIVAYYAGNKAMQCVRVCDVLCVM